MKLASSKNDIFFIVIVKASSKNLSSNLRSKHINVRYHLARAMLDAKSHELAKVHTNKNVSNTLTKVVTKEEHVFCRD